MKIRVKTRAAVLGIRALAASRRVARAAPSRNAGTRSNLSSIETYHFLEVFLTVTLFECSWIVPPV